ncbi:MAG TPA: carboxypeptidase regulatory-like domain-containing protein [Acidobacteriaceae bacterium]
MRFTTLAALLLVPAISTIAAQKTPPVHVAEPATLHAAPDKATSLPVTRVSLYKNGVGYFEHTGHVSGDAEVSIDFTTSQLNDVLQSLTAIDLNGGRISGAGYNSTTPFEQQLKTLPLSLNGNPTVAGFYNAIRGSRIELRSGSTTISGRLLSIETGDTIGSTAHSNSDSSDAGQKLLLTVISDGGEIRTVVVTTNTSVRLLDPALDLNVNRYLKLLEANRSQGLRHLTLEDNGTGSRELHVSYISEVPIWKSTYRILFTDKRAAGPAPTSSAHTATLQGWSVVDNTTGTDWINVHLSLIAGAPQSFIQPLSQPIYSHRPEIAIAQEAQLTPQTFESGGMTGGSPGSGLAGTVTDASGAVVPNTTITAINTATGSRETSSSDSRGNFNMNLPAGNYKLEASAPGFQRLVENNITVDGQNIASLSVPLRVGSASQSVEVSADAVSLNTSSAMISNQSISSLPIRNRYVGMGLAKISPGVAAPAPPPPPSYEEIASSSFSSNTQSNAFDDFFAYNLTEPVTIRKNESALVPILQANVDAERVTLVHSNGYSLSQPLRALWLTNTSTLTLDRGSFTIVEDGNFGGEGLLDPIHPSEKRLLSYAADQAIHVSTEGTINNNRVDRITASKGILTIQRAEHSEVTYVVRNAAAGPRTVVLEHPVLPGFTLDSSAKPDETTPTVYRFRIHANAGETVRLPIAANHRGSTIYELTNTNENQFATIVQQSNDNPRIAAAIAPILEARRRVAEADAAVDQTQTQLDNLHANEDRQRANITALHSADKSARDRFVNDLNHTEDQIVAAQKEMDTRTAAKEAAEEELAKRIESFQLDEKL